MIKIDTSIYWNINKLLSYNALWNWVIGERGVGKSYNAKKHVINHFIKTKKQFVWIRRHKVDLKTAIGSNTDKKFFENLDFINHNDMSITSDDKLYYISYKSKIMGYALSLRDAEAIKGTEFKNVDYIVFDEFLVGDGGTRYLKDEINYLLSIYETIARFRDVKIICLGNATSIFNPYFDFFKLSIPYNSEFKTFKNGLMVVNYIKNEKYRIAKKQSNFGKIIAGTSYEKYAIDNEFINDKNDFIYRKHIKSKLRYNLKINNKIIGIWSYQNKLYASFKHNVANNVCLTYNISNHDSNTVIIKSKSVYIQNLVNHFKVGTLFFENQEIKHILIDLFIELKVLY